MAQRRAAQQTTDTTMRIDRIHQEIIRQVQQLPPEQRAEASRQVLTTYQNMWMRSDDARAPRPVTPNEGTFSAPLRDMLRLYDQEYNRIQNLPQSQRGPAIRRLEEQTRKMWDDLEATYPQVQPAQPSPQQVVPSRRPAPMRTQAYVYRVTMGTGPTQQVYNLTLPHPIEEYYREGVQRGRDAVARGERLEGRSGIIPPSEAGATSRTAMLDSVLGHSVLNPPGGGSYLPGITVVMQGPPTPEVLTFNGSSGLVPTEEDRNRQVDTFRDRYRGRLDPSGVYVARNDVSISQLQPPPSRRTKVRGG